MLTSRHVSKPAGWPAGFHAVEQGTPPVHPVVIHGAAWKNRAMISPGSQAEVSNPGTEV
jgi:hypothetical protein